MATVSVDSREARSNPRVVEGLKANGLEVSVKALPVDYTIEVEGGWAVERKTCIDFAKSIRDGRLWGELEKLKSIEGLKPVLLVEGSLAVVEKFTSWAPQSIVGVLNSVMFDWNVHVVFVPSVKWTVTYLTQLAKSAEIEERKPYPLRVKQKAESPREYALMVVEGLPGVSAVRARALLKHFRTLRNLFNASVERLMEVEGVGRKTAERIYEVANFEYED
jgi:Fanconi anemia group M protein